MTRRPSTTPVGAPPQPPGSEPRHQGLTDDTDELLAALADRLPAAPGCRPIWPRCCARAIWSGSPAPPRAGVAGRDAGRTGVPRPAMTFTTLDTAPRAGGLHLPVHCRPEGAATALLFPSGAFAAGLPVTFRVGWREVSPCCGVAVLLRRALARPRRSGRRRRSPRGDRHRPRPRRLQQHARGGLRRHGNRRTGSLPRNR